MRPSLFAAATMVVAAFPAAPALAHCRTVHHRVHHVRHVAVRHHVVHYAGCACRRHVAYRHAAYPIVYRRPRVVEVTYEPPVYRPYPMVYEEPIYRPHRVFYDARFGGARFHRWGGYGFEHRGHRWGGEGFEHRGYRRGGWR